MLNPANTVMGLHECPHRAFDDPLVASAMNAYTHWAKGELAMYEPDPGPKLLEAIQCVHISMESYKADAIESSKRRAEAKAAANDGRRTREPV